MQMSSDPLNVTEFLLQRIAEDEAVARAATYEPDPDYPVESDDPWGRHGEFAGRGGVLFTHILHNNPARVLAECAAKRAIIKSGPDSRNWADGKRLNDYAYRHDEILSILAAVYKDHPDYDAVWEL